MTQVTTDKSTLRIKLRDARQTLTREPVRDASAKVTEQLKSMDCLQQATTVFCYVSIFPEVDTHDLIAWLLERKVAVYVPVLLPRRTMVAQRLRHMNALVPGVWDIPTLPFDPHQVLVHMPDITITPCLAVTTDGRRLGHGAGYYDRFLAMHQGTTAIVPALESQLVADLPTEPHDQCVHWIVTPHRVIETSLQSGNRTVH